MIVKLKIQGSAIIKAVIANSMEALKVKGASCFYLFK